MNRDTAELPVLLVAEPDYLVRETIVGVVRNLDLATVVALPGLPGARQALESRGVDFMLLALDKERELMDLLQALRAGSLQCADDTPVAVMTANAGPGLVVELKALGVHRLLIKPYKIKTLIETLQAMAQNLRTADAAQLG